MVFLVPLQAENCALYVGLHRKVNDEHSFNERINWQIDRRIINLVFSILEKKSKNRYGMKVEIFSFVFCSRFTPYFLTTQFIIIHAWTWLSYHFYHHFYLATF